ncbi:hypothetical protein D6833_00770 [Candidatus Parcubacteria bacterium]|nr:MAG: hypothetical protein D6833_00770 [Candidatus Parcubacteria bacterium]
MQRSGFTCIELAAIIFIMGATSTAGVAARNVFGNWGAGLAAGAIAAAAACVIVKECYRWSNRIAEREMRELSERFPRIFRVLVVPRGLPCVMARAAEIRVGDYGWEAEPIYDDGLIYLHGLTEEWKVAWYAGFRPEHIEVVGEKPRSQYFLPYSWICNGAEAPRCPFPVQHSAEETLGFPQRIIFPFVQGVKVEVRRRHDSRST